MSDSLRAYALLTAVASCWAVNTILAKLAVGEISPMALVSVRWFFSLSLVCAIALPSLRRDWEVLRKYLGLLLTLGAVGFATFNGLLYLAAHHTSALNISILQGVIPVFVLLGVALSPGGGLVPLQLLGVAVTHAGVVVVAAGGDLRGLAAFTLNLGDGLIMGACAIYAGYTVWLRNRPQIAPLSQFAIMAAGAWFASWPMLIAEIGLVGPQETTLRGWGIALATAVFPSLLAQVWFIRGVELIGPSRAGSFVNLVPVLAALLSVMILGERFMLYHGIGLALVFGGIALSEQAGAVGVR